MSLHRAALFSLLVVAGCRDSTAPVGPDRSTAAAREATPDASPSASTSASPVALTDAASPGPSALAPLADSTNALGFDIYASARKGRPNVALSPLSIALALSMVWAGARGETAAQMKSVLHEGGDPAEALDADGKALAWMRDPSQTVTLRVANRLFGEKTEPFEADYLTRVNAAFGAPLQPLDFVAAAEASRLQINDWVASNTDQHVKGLLPSHAITADSRLVVANAVYFLGAWDRPFKPEQTSPAPFHLSAKAEKPVPTMHEVETLPYAKADGVALLRIPYAGGDLAMTFVLPDAIDGLADVETKLSLSTLAAWDRAMASARVNVALPSFEIPAGEPLALRGILSALGMPLAFDRRAADFTAIANPPRPEDRLALGDVFHKAYVKLDEHGTEAAAATGAVLRKTLLVRRIPPVVFAADHPFLFLLRDVASGTILFIGHVGDPGLRSPP